MSPQLALVVLALVFIRVVVGMSFGRKQVLDPPEMMSEAGWSRKFAAASSRPWRQSCGRLSNSVSESSNCIPSASINPENEIEVSKPILPQWRVKGGSDAGTLLSDTPTPSTKSPFTLEATESELIDYQSWRSERSRLRVHGR